jgi:hypothetical protein
MLSFMNISTFPSDRSITKWIYYCNDLPILWSLSNDYCFNNSPKTNRMEVWETLEFLHLTNNKSFACF